MSEVIEKGFKSVENPNELYRKGFKDIDSGEIYHDPFGKRNGEKMLGADKLRKAQEKAFELWDAYMEKGYNFRDAQFMVRKALETGDWDIPAFVLPSSGLVNPEDTPLANGLARQTTNQTTVRATYVESGNEPSVSFSNVDAQTGDYSHSDITWSEKDYGVKGYYVMCGISDKIKLTENSRGNHRDVVQNVMLDSVRQWEEEEIIQGTDAKFTALENSSPSSGSASGQVDEGSVTKSDIRNVISASRQAGCSPSQMAVVMNHEAYKTLRNDLDTLTRYPVVQDNEAEIGFDALDFDGVPVMPSHGVDTNVTANGDYHTVAFNMAESYMAMLQDSVLVPTGKQGPQEQISVDTYGTFVQEKPPHNKFLEGAA